MKIMDCKIEKNPADDTSFEELSKMYTQLWNLCKEIEIKSKKMRKLRRKIEKESMRLKEIGYDVDHMTITIF